MAKPKLGGAASALFGNKPTTDTESKAPVKKETAKAPVKKKEPQKNTPVPVEPVPELTEKGKPGPKAVLPVDFEKKVYSLDPTIVKKIKGYAAMNDLNESMLVNEILESYISKKMG